MSKHDEAFQIFPSSFAQERLWFVEHYVGPTDAFVLRRDVALPTPVDRSAVVAALRSLVQRHEALRTRLVHSDAGVLQHVYSDDTIDTTSVNGPDGSSTPAVLLDGQRQLFHAQLMEERSVVRLVLHHAIGDGWSLSILEQEFLELYHAALRGRDARLCPLPIQYSDFAAWQRDQVASGRFSAMLDEWSEYLFGSESTTILPDYTFARGIGPGATLRVDLPLDIHRAMVELTARLRATTFMGYAAAFAAVVARHARSDDVVLGSPFLGRVRPETFNLVGLLSNMLPLRFQVNPASSFSELVQHVRDRLVWIMARQEVPYETLVRKLLPSGRGESEGLFEITVAVEDGDANAPRGLNIAADAQHDLAIVLETGDRPALSVHYRRDRYTTATVARLLSQIIATVTHATSDPDTRLAEVDLISADDAQLLRAWNDTVRPRLARTVVDMVAAWAEQLPTGTAIVEGDHAITYPQLLAAGRAWAAYLGRLGIGTGDRVVIVAPRGIRQVCASLGVMTLGATYAPMDPVHPLPHLADLIARSRAKAVIHGCDELPIPPSVASIPLDLLYDAGEADDASVRSLARPEDGAYMLFTSGSTGQPKGVVITQSSFANLLEWHIEHFALTPRDVVSQFAGPGFDVSAWEIWSALAAGATLAITPEVVRGEPRSLFEWLSRNQVTMCFLPTPLVEELEGETSSAPLHVRAFLTAGAHLRRHPRGPFSGRLYNLYGPTETTVVVTCGLAEERDSLDPTIGKPIANCRIYVLDDALRLCPIGVPGDLYIAGACVAEGYFGDEELTALRFAPDPFVAGERMYKSGDVARWRNEGTIEFLGRADRQIKIRGHRIEPAEIERFLMSLPGISNAWVQASARANGEIDLVAYLAGDATSLPSDTIRSMCRANLPFHMVPRGVIVLDRLPLTVNGKVDAARLPAFSPESVSTLEPRTELERRMTDVMRETLGVPTVGITDNFFDMGGDSLLALRLAGVLRSTFGVDLSLSEIFENATPEGLARLLDHAAASR